MFVKLDGLKSSKLFDCKGISPFRQAPNINCVTAIWLVMSDVEDVRVWGGGIRIAQIKL